MLAYLILISHLLGKPVELFLKNLLESGMAQVVDFHFDQEVQLLDVFSLE